MNYKTISKVLPLALTVYVSGCDLKAFTGETIGNMGPENLEESLLEAGRDLQMRNFEDVGQAFEDVSFNVPKVSTKRRADYKAGVTQDVNSWRNSAEKCYDNPSRCGAVARAHRSQRKQ